jgi:predicted nucleic acid-binding protein
MSVVNVGEVWYILSREVSDAEADKSIGTLRSWGVEFVAADWPHAKEAASLKAKHKMSYADAFAAALARVRKAELVTGDPEFKQVEDYASIRWLSNEE